MDAVSVVGAGGIGCAVGYALLTAGRRVVFVESDPAKVEWGRRNGVAVNGRPAEQVAAELGISAQAVYLAKARVLRRLRQELEGLVD